jgi:hypothetical protein
LKILVFGMLRKLSVGSFNEFVAENSKENGGKRR